LPVEALVALVAVRPVATILAILALSAILTGRLFATLGQLFLALVGFEFLVAWATLILILEAGAALAQDAEIMVRELEIIFGLDAVSRKLGVARHALVFFEQLGRIAALAIVLAVARLSTEIPASALSSTAAPAAALTIIDQMPTSLRSVACPFCPRMDRAAHMRRL
jgi:hypothetical protein